MFFKKETETSLIEKFLYPKYGPGAVMGTCRRPGYSKRAASAGWAWRVTGFTPRAIALQPWKQWMRPAKKHD